jgi:hypothetical protein
MAAGMKLASMMDLLITRKLEEFQFFEYLETEYITDILKPSECVCSMVTHLLGAGLE